MEIPSRELLETLADPLKWAALGVILLTSIWFSRRVIGALFYPLKFIMPEVAHGVLRMIGYVAFVVLTMLAAANLLSVEVTPLFGLVLVAATSIVVMSAQGVIGNAIYGIIIQHRDWFSLREFVEVGEVQGTVIKIDAFAMQIITVDNEIVSIPWNIVIEESFTNISRSGFAPIEAFVHVPGEFSLDLAMKTIRDAIDRFQVHEKMEWPADVQKRARRGEEKTGEIGRAHV